MCKRLLIWLIFGCILIQFILYLFFIYWHVSHVVFLRLFEEQEKI